MKCRGGGGSKERWGKGGMDKADGRLGVLRRPGKDETA